MTTTSLHWVTSNTGGQFTYTPDGKTIREYLGVWFVFDQDDTLIGKYPTRDAAVANA